jgi:hypothetical protein
VHVAQRAVWGLTGAEVGHVLRMGREGWSACGYEAALCVLGMGGRSLLGYMGV